jgi:hypothetical protein
VPKLLTLLDDFSHPDWSHLSLPLLLRDDQIWRMGDHGLALIESESSFTEPIRQNRRVGFSLLQVVICAQADGLNHPNARSKQMDGVSTW